MLNILQLLSVEQRIAVNSLSFIHRLVNGDLPEYLEFCQKDESVNVRYNTRSVDDLSVTRVIKTRTQKSIFYTGIRHYNKLGNAIKKEVNVKIFRELCAQYVRDIFPLE